MSEDERAIRELVDNWMAASRAGDIAAVLEMVTDDVLFLTPGREPFGKQEFSTMSQAMKDVRIDGRASIRELEVTGDWAWLRNHIELDVTPGDGNPSHRSGDTLTVFRKGRDGRWRLHRDANFVN